MLFRSLTIFWAAAPAYALIAGEKDSRRKFFPVTLALASFIACLLYGHLRLSGASDNSTYAQYTAPITVRIVQPNTPQEEKWSLESVEKNLSRLIAYSLPDHSTSPSPATAGTTIIVWPETAIEQDILESEIGRAHV